MIICVYIDETICKYPQTIDCALATSFYNSIDKDSKLEEILESYREVPGDSHAFRQ